MHIAKGKLEEQIEKANSITVLHESGLKEISDTVEGFKARLSQCEETNTSAIATNTEAFVAKIAEIEAAYNVNLAKSQQAHQTALAENTKLISARQVEIEALVAKMNSDASVGANAKAQIDAINASTGKTGAQIDQLLTQSNASFEKIKSLASTSSTVETRVAEYEAQMETMSVKYDALVNTIEGLLPKATSAGLASAFSDQKKGYAGNLSFWKWFRLGAIAIIIVYGFWVYQDFSKALGSMQANIASELMMTALVWLVNKSPIFLGLILLEEFSRRSYNRYFKLQEDYGHKQVMSQSFEGYKKQFLDLGSSPTGNNPLSELCQNTIKAISESPIRLINEEKDSGGRAWWAFWRREKSQGEKPR